MATIQTREPEIFAAGDTLRFCKSLPDYLPADGWALEYIFTTADGSMQIAVNATANGPSFSVNQNGFAAGLDPQAGILEGFVSKDSERHRVYYGQLTLQNDSPAGAPVAAVKTTAQKMLDEIEASLIANYRAQFQETDVQRNRFVRQKTAELLDAWKFWNDKRENEIQIERGRAGRPTGAVSVPIFLIG